MRVAILSCRDLPRFVTWEIPDTDALFADDRLLIAAFDQRKVAAESVVWNDPGVDWNGYDVALIRSTWEPFVDSVISEGEWSFVFVAGEFSHALLKTPAAGDYRSQSIYGGTVEPVVPRPEDLRQAEAILAALPYDLLYARLDLVRVDSRLAVMELELIEPILYLGLAPHGPGLLASATITRAATP